MAGTRDRYDPSADYAYDPADMMADIGEDLGQYQDPVNHARDYIRNNPDRVRDVQENAMAERAARRLVPDVQQPTRGVGTKLADQYNQLEDLLKQQ